MNPKYDIYEWIDLYLNGEMTESEKLEFEDRLLNDSQLADAFAAQKVAHKIVIGEELLQLKRQMALDLSKPGNPVSGAAGNTWKYMISGAAVVAAVLIVYLFTNNNSTNKNDAVLADSTSESRRNNAEYSVNSSLQKLEDQVDSIYTSKQNPVVKSTDAVISGSDHQSKSNRVLCSDSIINFSCQARAACIQKNDGVIEIDVNTIKSVKGPFLFSLKPDHGFQKEPTITDLKSGSYHVYVKDSRQCLHELNVQDMNCANSGTPDK